MFTSLPNVKGEGALALLCSVALPAPPALGSPNNWPSRQGQLGLGWGQITFHWLELGHLVTGSGQCLAVTSERKARMLLSQEASVWHSLWTGILAQLASSSCGERCMFLALLALFISSSVGTQQSCGGHTVKEQRFSVTQWSKPGLGCWW